jgi:hypothetical protein
MGGPARDVALTVRAHIVGDGRVWGSVGAGADTDVGFEGWLELLVVLHRMLDLAAGEPTSG